MKLYEGNLRILIKWLQKMQQVLYKQGTPHKPGDGGPIDIIDKGIGALYSLKKEPNSFNVPISSHFQVNSQWIEIALDELYKFNAMGDEYICSTVEAVIKCNGIKKLIDHYETPLYFRGEHNFGWDLISRLGRKIHIDWSTESLNHVTVEEKRLLSNFQERCQKDHETRTLVFGYGEELLPFDHAGWWSLMQHYDDNYGTRMIDVTSSLYCALFFASADWDGTVDSRVDGKLYMFPYPPGRGDSVLPDMENGRVIGCEDQRNSLVDTYFDVAGSLDYPRFRTSPVRNDRALSQDGYFVWQPKFDEPLKTFQIFPFRVHREYKNDIIKELAAMGYTRERILSVNRFSI